MSAEYTFHFPRSGSLTVAFVCSVYEAIDSTLHAAGVADISGGVTIVRGLSTVRFDDLTALRAAIPPLEAMDEFHITRLAATQSTFMHEPSISVDCAAGEQSFSVICLSADLSSAQSLAMALSSALGELLPAPAPVSPPYEDPVQIDEEPEKARIGDEQGEIAKKTLKWQIVGVIVAMIIGLVTIAVSVILWRLPQP